MGAFYNVYSFTVQHCSKSLSQKKGKSTFSLLEKKKITNNKKSLCTQLLSLSVGSDVKSLICRSPMAPFTHCKIHTKLL